MTTLDKCAEETEAMHHRNSRVVLWCVECRNTTAKAHKAIAFMVELKRMSGTHDDLPRVIRSKCYFCDKPTTKFVDLEL